MDTYFIILAIAAAVFAAGVMLLSAKPEFMSRVTAATCVLAAVLGLMLYGYGYTALGEPPIVAVIRSVYSVCRMFVGENDFLDFAELAVYQHTGLKVLMWMVHLMAFYTTVSVAVSVMGKEVLKKARIRFGRARQINIFYGAHADAVEMGKRLERSRNQAVVYVDPEPDPELSYVINAGGQLLRSDGKAVSGSEAFLRSIGAFRKRRKVTVYALAADPVKNLHYARKVLDALEKERVDPTGTKLVILSREDLPVDILQNSGSGYGYGMVNAFREQALTARLVTKEYPPCDYLRFDDQGCAQEDFHALVIGFGRVGQAVLRQLIMHGQFTGSTFRATVFDPECEAATGFFARQHRNVLDHYDLSFHPYDGRSHQLCDFLTGNKDSVKYVVICTGSEDRNEEIAEDLSVMLRQLGSTAPVIRCTHRDICMQTAQMDEPVRTGVYAADVLYTDDIDEMAMLVNNQYHSNRREKALEEWMVCDYFSRMSCRAFADAIRGFLRAVGKTEEDVLRGDWDLTEQQLQNLGMMEHERWCAFHYCMGYSPMTREEFQERAQTHLDLCSQGLPGIRIGKNTVQKTHACLIGWEELDVLSVMENSFSGKNVNYKQMDIDNVLTIPDLLRKREENN